jgi:hypothetical protein
LSWGLGIGDWGLGIGDWAQSPIPNPQSPIPNPQSPIPMTKIINFINYKNILFKIINSFLIYF